MDTPVVPTLKKPKRQNKTPAPVFNHNRPLQVPTPILVWGNPLNPHVILAKRLINCKPNLSMECPTSPTYDCLSYMTNQSKWRQYVLTATAAPLSWFSEALPCSKSQARQHMTKLLYHFFQDTGTNQYKLGHLAFLTTHSWLSVFTWGIFYSFHWRHRNLCNEQSFAISGEPPQIPVLSVPECSSSKYFSTDWQFQPF